MPPSDPAVFLVVLFGVLFFVFAVWRSQFPSFSEAIRQDLALARNRYFKAVIYIASPYSLGNKQTNVDIQRRTAHTLLDVGYCPMAPLLAHYLEEMRSRPLEHWMEMDFELIHRCDALLRLPGESKGADIEVALAARLGKPIFYSINELLEDGYERR